MNAEKKLRIFTYLAAGYSFVLYLYSLNTRKDYASLRLAKSVLVIPQLTRLGDVVCSIPAIFCLASAMGTRDVYVLVSKKVEGLLENEPYIKKIFYVEDYLANPFRLTRIFRSLRIDAGISLSGSPLSSVIFALSKISHRIKVMKDSRSMMEWLTDYLCQFGLLYKNHTDLGDHYLKAAGLITSGSCPSNRRLTILSSDVDQIAEKYLNTLPKKDNELWIAISLTAGNRVKEWGDDKFKLLADHILSGSDKQIFVVARSSDLERTEIFLSQFKGVRKIHAVYDIPLSNFAAFLKNMDLFIGVDTGPVYVADATGVPVIDILGPVDPNEQKPLGARSMLVRSPESPSLLMFRTPPAIEKLRRSIETTTAGMVIGAYEDFLRSR